MVQMADGLGPEKSLASKGQDQKKLRSDSSWASMSNDPL